MTHAKPYECDVCKVRFAHEQHLIAHQTTHIEDAPILCKTCGGKIPRSQEMQDNIDMLSKLGQLKANCSENDMSSQCDFCQEIESSEPSGIGYVCSLCGCGFGNLKKLEDHIVDHNVIVE
jgi:DNA-directed RNA polymerase subunit RPC12/RpoP